MPRATSGTECDRSRFPLLRFLLRLSPTRHGKRKEREAGRSVRPAGILTHVGSVLRQRAEEASPVLRVSSFSTTLSSTLARDSLPLSARTRISPRESSSTPPLSLSLLLARLLFLSPPSVVLPGFPLLRHLHVVTPPALPPSSASSSCRYRYHYHCPRHYHRRRRGVDGASSSTFSWPSPPAKSTWWLPHHLDDPASLSTNDQRLSLLRGV